MAPGAEIPTQKHKHEQPKQCASSTSQQPYCVKSWEKQFSWGTRQEIQNSNYKHGSGSARQRRWQEWKDLAWWMKPRKQCPPGTTGLKPVWTLRDCASTPKTCTGSSQIPAPRREVNRPPTPNEEAICHWYLLAKCYQMVCHWVHQPYSRAGPMSSPRWPQETKYILLWIFYFIFASFDGLLQFWFLFVDFDLFWQRKGGERTYSWVSRKVGESGRSCWGEGT